MKSRKRTLTFTCLALTGLAAFGGGAASAALAEGLPGQGFLPDGRVWEMVSPPQKNGSNINPDAQRTHAAADGNAIGFASLGVFGNPQGAGVATDYIAKRSTVPNPGDNGWSTHPITPKMVPTTFQELVQQLEPRYEGDYSTDLEKGIYFSASPLTDSPPVAQAYNLYLRDDLLSPGEGSYRLLTPCPRCEEVGTELPPAAVPGRLAPRPAGATPSFEQVIYESERRLTADAPETVGPFLYEWDRGHLALAGRVPPGAAASCDDSTVDSCVPAGASMAGQGTGNGATGGASHSPALTPHTISNGVDGHVRVFFTEPLNEAGTAIEVGPNSYEGNLYMRVDGHETVQLNASERTPAAPYKRARFLDASADGARAFFMTKQSLTTATPAGNAVPKLYMYEAAKPAGQRLTLLSIDHEPADGAEVLGLAGLSEAGDYVYFVSAGQLVKNGPTWINYKLFLWHAGTVSYIGSFPVDQTTLNELITSGANYREIIHQARVTPDGRHFLFSSFDGEGLTEYDHGSCTGLALSCREYYVYDADTAKLQCASCNPSGAAATVHAEAVVREQTGGSQTGTHLPQNISDNGRYVFFSSAERLVPEDTNGVSDAYVYDTETEQVRLLSSGTDPSPSYFLDASDNGHDAFIVTRQKLSGWDVDGATDVYDARIGGGFPEPSPAPASCQGDSCQPPPRAVKTQIAPASESLRGRGNERPARRPRCRKGQRRVRARGGKMRCVKAPKHRKHRKHTRKHKKHSQGRDAKHDRRAGQ